MIVNRHKLANRSKDVITKKQLKQELDFIQPRVISHRRKTTFQYDDDRLDEIRQILGTQQAEKPTNNSSFSYSRRSVPENKIESALGYSIRNPVVVETGRIKSDWEL